jgi:acyl-CoA-binding protein
MNHFEEIQKNMQGLSSDEEYQLFKKKLKENSNFTEEVRLYLETKQAVNGITHDQKSSFFSLNKNANYWFAAAASGALFLGIHFSLQQKNISPGELMGARPISIQKPQTDTLSTPKIVNEK